LEALMPLDVQPLSRTRRAIMLVVMLGLLGGSLGFAQWLVASQKPAQRIAVVFGPPMTPAQVNDSQTAALDKPPIGVTVRSDQDGKVTYYAFSFELDPRQPQTALQVLDKLLENMTGRKVPESAPLLPAVIHRYAGLQRIVPPVDGQTPRLDLLRLTVVEGHVVAFGFSGEGKITENDTSLFDNYCVNLIRISTGPDRP
jgi:hypothetical protein